MARFDLHPMFTTYRGRMGNIVYYQWRGRDCARCFVMPRNPDTAAQRVVRGSFRDAVHAWQAMSPMEREEWNRQARHKPLSGYNLFLSRYMHQACAASPSGSSGIHRAASSCSPSIQRRIHSVSAGIQPADRLYSASIPMAGPGKG